jgi:hypothetical protein
MLHHKTTPKTNIYYTMAYEEAYAYEYAEEDLITCDYCGNRWDGCAQCNCWGYLNSAGETASEAETSEAASEAETSEAETSETASSETASEAAASETASEAAASEALKAAASETASEAASSEAATN